MALTIRATDGAMPRASVGSTLARNGIVALLFASCIFVGGVQTVGGAPARPAVAAPRVQSPHYSLGTMYVRNPHLHSATLVPAGHGAKHSLSAHRHAWHHRWAYHSWVTVRRSLGMVQGIVRDSHGRPVGNAVVELKQSNGHSFHHSSQRHKTHTNSNGAFVMTGVRSGHYRLSSYKGKHHGHARLTVHTASVSTAEIKV